MQEIKVKNSREVQLFVDNKSKIDLSKDPATHGKSKHIETGFHFLRDQVNKGKLILEYYKIELQVAYIFYKGLEGRKVHGAKRYARSYLFESFKLMRSVVS